MELLGETLKKAAGKQGLEKVYEAGTLIPRWEKIVGQDVSKNAQPTMIRGETLIVRVANPVWSHQLTMLKQQIIEKLQKEGIKVNDIVFRAAAPLEKKKDKVKKKTISAPPSFSALPAGMEPDLRRALASFMGAQSIAKGEKRPNKQLVYDKIEKKKT